MLSAALPKNEVERLQALHESGLLGEDTPHNLDRFTRLAQALFGCKISLVSLVDENRQWFRSRQGITVKETSRDISFCAHAVFNDHLLYVPDASLDKRFADNPMVTGEPAIRLYAGVPLHSPDGYALGTLCVIDDIPRDLNQLQLTLLQDLAYLAEAEIARSIYAKQAEKLQKDKIGIEQERQRLAAFIESSRLATWQWDIKSGAVIFNPRWAQMVGYDLAELMPANVDIWLKLLHPADKQRAQSLLQRHFAGETPFFEMECRLRHREGHWVWILTQGKVILNSKEGEPLTMAGTNMDISDRKANEKAIASAYSLLQRVCRDADIDLSEQSSRPDTQSI